MNKSVACVSLLMSIKNIRGDVNSRDKKSRPNISTILLGKKLFVIISNQFIVHNVLVGNVLMFFTIVVKRN